MRGGAGQVVEPAALDLADGERAEAVDDRVGVATLGERPLGARPQLARGDRVVGEDRVPAPGDPGGTAGAGQQPARARAPSSRKATIAAKVDSGGASDAASMVPLTSAVEPVQELLEQVAVVVLRAHQLAPQQRPGLVAGRVERRLERARSSVTTR